MQSTDLKNLSKEVRKLTLEIIHSSGSSHIGGAYSMTDILVYLYFKFMVVNPENDNDPNRDRFILSKGHACSSLYSVLALKGFFSKDNLKNYAQNGSVYLSHSSHKVNGVEFSAGSLGHGLSIAIGMALKAKLTNENWKTICLISDGELNEGSIWEGILLAPHLELNSLILVVDYNKIQSLGHVSEILPIEPLKEKFEAFHWNVHCINGHDFDQLDVAFNSLNNKKPTVIIADTIKGKGVSFMENSVLWHYKSPNSEEFSNAMKELNLN